jgi:hypothetical protein
MLDVRQGLSFSAVLAPPPGGVGYCSLFNRLLPSLLKMMTAPACRYGILLAMLWQIGNMMMSLWCGPHDAALSWCMLVLKLLLALCRPCCCCPGIGLRLRHARPGKGKDKLEAGALSLPFLQQQPQLTSQF